MINLLYKKDNNSIEHFDMNIHTHKPIFTLTVKESEFEPNSVLETCMKTGLFEGETQKRNMIDMSLIKELLNKAREQMILVTQSKIKFYVSIIINKKDREYQLRIDNYVEPITTCLKARQDFFGEKEPKMKENGKLPECTFDLMNRSIFPGEMVVSIFDTSKMVPGFPLIIIPSTGETCDICDMTSLSFFASQDSCSYQIDNYFMTI